MNILDNIIINLLILNISATLIIVIIFNLKFMIKWIHQGSNIDQDLIDWFTSLILEIQPGAQSDRVFESVQNKINGLIAQEPFFLRAVLANERLSPSDKVSKYIGVHTKWDTADRYPEKYHQDLKKQTSMLLGETA